MKCSNVLAAFRFAGLVFAGLTLASCGDDASDSTNGAGGTTGGSGSCGTTCMEVCLCSGATMADCTNVCGGAGGAGVGGAGVGGAGVGGAGGGNTVIPARCAGDASKTMMIGDSYLALSGDVTRYLQMYSGQTYRTYYVSGTQMVGGLPPSIPDQARQGYAQGPVQTVIMTGGGNDVLIGDATCRTAPTGPQCTTTIHNALNAAEALMNEGATMGVQEVVYFFYPHLPGSLLAPVELNQTLDFAYPLAHDLCEGSAVLDCSFVDTRQAFQGHPEFIGPDGIHPTAPGSEVIAQLLWAVMQENCQNGVRLP